MAVAIDWFGEGDEDSDLLDIYRTMDTNELLWMERDLRVEIKYKSDLAPEFNDEAGRRLDATRCVLVERGAISINEGVVKYLRRRQPRGLEDRLPPEVLSVCAGHNLNRLRGWNRTGAADSVDGVSQNIESRCTVGGNAKLRPYAFPAKLTWLNT